jgi:hypothetical protein
VIVGPLFEEFRSGTHRHARISCLSHKRTAFVLEKSLYYFLRLAFILTALRLISIKVNLNKVPTSYLANTQSDLDGQEKEVSD